MPRGRDECWQEVTRTLDETGKRHPRVACKHCLTEWTSNEKARVIEHLQRCTELPEALWRVYQPHRLDPTLPSAHEIQQQQRSRTRSNASMSAMEQDMATAACAQWITAAGLNPNTVEHPAFRAFVRTLRPAFHPPTRHQLTLALIDVPLMVIAYFADPHPRTRRPSILEGDEESQSRSLQAFLLRYCDGNIHKASLLLGMISLLRVKEGPFSNEMVWIACEQMTPIQWWHNFWLEEQPELALLCIIALAIVPTGDTTERNWSPHAFTHNLKRNQLNSDVSNRLVTAFWNLRLKHGWIDESASAAVNVLDPDSEYTADVERFIGVHG